MGAPSLRASIGSLLDAVTPAPGERGCGRPGTCFLPSHSICRRGLPVAQPTGRTETAGAGSDRSTQPRGGTRSRLWSPPNLSAGHGAGHTLSPAAGGQAKGDAQTGPLHTPAGPRKIQLWGGGCSGAVLVRWVLPGGGTPPHSCPLISDTPQATDSGAPQRHSEQPVSCRRCSQARKKCASCRGSACRSPHDRTQHSSAGTPRPGNTLEGHTYPHESLWTSACGHTTAKRWAQVPSTPQVGSTTQSVHTMEHDRPQEE